MMNKIGPCYRAASRTANDDETSIQCASDSYLLTFSMYDLHIACKLTRAKAIIDSGYIYNSNHPIPMLYNAVRGLVAI